MHPADPMGTMLLDYLKGRGDAALKVHSEEVEIWTMSAELMMRPYNEMDALEKTALSLCKGRVLDAGAGAGCHSLHLQSMGLDVEALDISPGCVEAMRERGVQKAFLKDIFSPTDQRYDTILMLMNGLGLCGTIDRLNLFLQQAKNLLTPRGKIIGDSTDISLFLEDDTPLLLSDYPGEVEFIMEYEDITSAPFPWLYIDFDSLATLASLNDLYCEQISAEDDGRFLVVIENSRSTTRAATP